METPATFILALALLFFSGAESSTFTFTNNCPYTVWPATLTGGGTPQLSSTGFELASKASQTLTVTAPWSGRVWARTGCTTDPSGKFICLTGDCGSGKVECSGAGGIPPASLAEFTLAPNGGQDFYDISLVDGFNLPISAAPKGAAACQSTSCAGNVNSVCPAEMAVKGNDGRVVACKSACEAFNQPEYCCTGAFGSPTTCPPTEYSKIFKAKCPQAYSYAYDDKTSTFTCTGGPDYVITFCP